jgi:hypothetical protein
MEERENNMADDTEQAAATEEVVTQDVTQEQDDTGKQPVVQLATLPSHLNAQWFDVGVAVPDWMNDPNWMNVSGTLNAPLYVRLTDGTVQQTASPIHLGHWLNDLNGVIIAAPQEG